MIEDTISKIESRIRSSEAIQDERRGELLELLGTLKSELSVAMILTGCANLRDAGRELLDVDG